MVIGIVIIGDEILTGRRQDKHFSQTIEALAKRGLELAWARYCGDDEARLIQQFGDINVSGDLCFSFGGIGATHDDRTRQAMAAAFERPIERHPKAAGEIEAQFGERAYPNRILMADLPRDAELIPNPFNRIPGFSLDHIHCLPGFPHMVWPMLEWVLDTRYPDLRAEQPVQLSLIVHHANESDLITLLSGIQNKYPSIKLSSLPRFLANNEREVELGFRGEARAAHDALIETKQQLQQQRYELTE